jgi:DNA-directed RNA polymerase beta subunit
MLENGTNVGDKITSGHSQKGTVSSEVPQSELFCTEDGVYPDIIVGPAYLPSRMTISQPIEGYMNFRALQEGRFIDSTAHTPMSQFVSEDALRSPNKIKMINKHGIPMVNKIDLMYCHYMNLDHFVKDKYYHIYNSARDYNLQPIKGNNKKGGLKLDVMSKNVLMAQGSGQIFNNASRINSDIYDMPVDTETHTLKYSENQTMFNTCKSTSNFIQYCNAMNISVKIE